jgi:RNA polymerase sigma-70 factor (ECF subfamily)
MYNLVRSAATDFLRRRRTRREGAHLSLVAVETVAAPPAPSEEALEHALERALSGLAPERRVAVRLHLDGKHLNDIAELLGWTSAKARNLLYRGLDDLKGRLEAERAGGDPP